MILQMQPTTSSRQPGWVSRKVHPPFHFPCHETPDLQNELALLSKKRMGERLAGKWALILLREWLHDG